MFIGDLIGMTFESIDEMIALIEKEFVYPVTDCGDSLIGINDGEEYGGAKICYEFYYSFRNDKFEITKFADGELIE